MHNLINLTRYIVITTLIIGGIFIGQSYTAFANPLNEEDSLRQGSGESIMKIQFVFDDQTVSATLQDTASARDFASQLPLTFELEDYASTEKIAYLPSKLTTEGAPSGTSAKVGDISYYAPWGNMVIFYRDFGYASGLIKLGTIDGGVERFTANASQKVTIELVK